MLINRIFIATFYLIFYLFLQSCTNNASQDDLLLLPKNFANQLPQRIQYLEKMQLENPNNSNIPFILSKYYLQTNQNKKALLAINTSIQLASATKKHLFVQSNCFFKLNQFEKSYQILQKFNIQELMDADNMAQIVDIYMKLKKYTELETLLQSIPKNNKILPNIENYNITISLSKKDTVMATQGLKNLITKYPKNYELHQQLSSLYYAQKQYGMAISTSKIVMSQPEYFSAATLITAQCYEKLALNDSIIKYSENYLLNDSSNIQAQKMLIYAAFADKKYLLAANYLLKTNADFSNIKDYNFIYGVCLIYTGNANQALNYLEKILPEQNNYKQAQYYLKKYAKK